MSFQNESKCIWIDPQFAQFSSQLLSFLLSGLSSFFGAEHELSFRREKAQLLILNTQKQL